MSRYTADPTKDSAGFPVLPKGDYRLKIGEPKAFKGETTSGNRAGQDNYGVAFTCSVVPGLLDGDSNESPTEYIGKKVYQRLYYHTPESRNFSKGFILAAFGFSNKEENLFNDKINKIKEENPDNPAVDWSFDPDDGSVGEAWRGMTNTEIVASLSVQKDKNDNDQQRWEQVRPIPEANN